jgi:hypothetical protein
MKYPLHLFKSIARATFDACEANNGTLTKRRSVFTIQEVWDMTENRYGWPPMDSPDRLIYQVFNCPLPPLNKEWNK